MRTVMGEDVKVYDYRIEWMMDLGLNKIQAHQLATRPDIVHDLQTLIDQGCHPVTAYKILR